MKEEWRDIPEWEEIYQISNRGRCKRIANGFDGRHLPERILKPIMTGWNRQYIAYCLRWGRTTTRIYAHRAVLIAFTGSPPDENYQVNHKNGDKQHNWIDNLEWVTPQENQEHRYTTLGQSQNGEQNLNNVLTNKEVKQIRNLYALGNYSQATLAKMFAVSRVNISLIVRRKRWSHVD